MTTKKKSQLKCSECGSKKIEKASNKEGKKRYSYFKFQPSVRNDTHYCQECGITFTPSCSKGIEYFTLFLGIFCFVSCCCEIYGVYMVLMEESRILHFGGVGVPAKPFIIIPILLLPFVFIASVLAIKYSLKTFLGKSGKME